MFDLVLLNANVIDGSGGPASRADVGIKGPAIAAVEKSGALAGATSRRTVDVAGKTVCPGFVDAHSHADLTYFRPDHPELLAPLVKQGVTTFMGGHCGMSLAPVTKEHGEGQQAYLEVFTQMDFDRDVRWSTMGGFMDLVEKEGLVMNTAMLAPHGMIRISAMGLETRLANDRDIAAMKVLVEECMEAGAFGMSTGLQYFPGNQSDTRELIELAGTLRRHDGLYASHMRSYSHNTLPQAIDEVAQVARANDIRGQVSHIYSLPWFGRMHRHALKGLKWLARHADTADRLIPDAVLFDGVNKTLARIAEYRDAGVRLGVDIVPSTAGFTHLLAFFPSWALAGGRASFLERISDPMTRKEIRDDIEHGEPAWPHRGRNDWSLNIIRQIGWDAVTLMAVHGEGNRQYEGRRFSEIAADRGADPFDVMCDILVEENGRVLVTGSLAEPGDSFTEKLKVVPAVMDPEVSIVSDAILLGMGKPSYMFYGCYPRIMQMYVFDSHVISLPEAIRRFTHQPAVQCGIENRGLVREGYFADLLVMEPEKFRTRSVFADPEHSPEGLHAVIINGKVVLEDGEYRPGGHPGMMLRKHDQSVPVRGR